MDIPTVASGSIDDTKLEVPYALFVDIDNFMWSLENTNTVMKLKGIAIVMMCVVLLAVSSDGHAQVAARRDSLEQLLKTDVADSTHVKILNKLATLYQFYDFGKSLKYATEAVRISEAIGNAQLKAKSYLSLSYRYTLSGDYSSALKFDNLAIQNSMKIQDSVLIASSHNNLGNDYYDLGKYDEAYFYFTLSYTIGKRIDDSLRMAIALHNVGRVFKALGQYGPAIEHLKLSRRISTTINDAIGEPYYFDEIGDVYMRKGMYDSALTSLRNALTLAVQQNEQVLKPTIFTKMAKVYSEKNDFVHALAYYDSTYTLYNRTNNQYGIAEVNLGKAKLLQKQMQYEPALTLIESSLAKAHQVNARVLEIDCYKTLHEVAIQQGDFKKSLYYFKQYKNLEDTLFSQEMLQKLYRDQFRFESESKDLQIAALLQKDDKQKDLLKREEFLRNILAVVVALSVILLVTTYRSGQRRKQINTLLLQHHDEMEHRSEELERLNQVKDKFFSIISHDLRSPINALSGILDIMSKGGLSQEEFDEQTQELRIRFNHTRTLLNNLLDWTLLQMDKLSLQPVKINIKRIIDENIELLTSLNTKRIQLINNLPEQAVGFADSNTINLVIRNLMTNAIKFTNDGGVVTMDGVEKEKEWQLSVHDNGVGIKPEVMQILFDKTAPYTTRGTANEKGTGLGLILCKEFIEKNNGRIWVESKEDKGSTFYFTIPKG